MLGRYARYLFLIGGLVPTTTTFAQEKPHQPEHHRAAILEAQPSGKKALPESLTLYDVQNLVASREANRIAAQSATAAVRQADYAFVQLFFAGFGVVFTAVAAVAAIAAAVYAKKAADHTEAGANEARRSADAADEQLGAVKTADRAYVNFGWSSEEDEIGNIVIEASNSGRTRAHILFARFIVREKLPARPGLVGLRLARRDADVDLPPNADWYEVLTIPAPIPKRAKHVLGYVEYADVYRERWRQYFRYDRGDGEWVNTGGLRWGRTERADGDETR